MTDPKRLLDELAGSDSASLLRSLRAAEPPSLAKQSELVQRMITPVAAPLPAAGLAAKTWLAIGAAVVASSAAGTWLSLPTEPVAAVKAAPVAVSPPHSLAPHLPPEPLPVVQAPLARAAVTPPAPVNARPTARDTLAEEESLLEQARRALGASPGAALALLRRHQQRFPSGQLTAERMYLSVDALRRAGDRAGAERQRQALLKRFPTSVYAGQLRAEPTP